MARVILEVPRDKMQSFLQAVLEIGIDQHAIESEYPGLTLAKPGRPFPHHDPAESFILFDWEFFINELEYE